MARLPRLAAAGRLHFVVQRGHPSQPVFVDDEDRRAYVAALREAAAAHDVQVHAFALADHEVQLLVTPPDEAALSQAMQAVGRRYVGARNRRHGSRGTAWEGRFRCGIVEPGAPSLFALLLVDGSAGWSSATHRSGGARENFIVDPPEFWALGNTPFEREAAYRLHLAQGVAPEVAAPLRAAAMGGWAYGSPAFVEQLAGASTRRAAPRRPGRPPRGGGPGGAGTPAA